MRLYKYGVTMPEGSDGHWP